MDPLYDIPPSRLLDAVVEGRLKTEELLLTVEAVNQISKLHDDLIRTLEDLSVVEARLPQACYPHELMTITVQVPKHNIAGCRTARDVLKIIADLAVDAFAVQYGRIKDEEVREDIQRMEAGREDAQDNSERLDTPGV